MAFMYGSIYISHAHGFIIPHKIRPRIPSIIFSKQNCTVCWRDAGVRSGTEISIRYIFVVFYISINGVHLWPSRFKLNIDTLMTGIVRKCPISMVNSVVKIDRRTHNQCNVILFEANKRNVTYLTSSLLVRYHISWSWMKKYVPGWFGGNLRLI